MKKDNFKNYRIKQVEINANLIQKAIDSIIAIDGTLSNNNVSKTTYLIADEKLGEKGVTPSTISKNNIYKSLIEKAKLKKHDNAKGISKFSTNGDLRIELFKSNIEKEKLKKENIVLKDLLKKYGGDLTKIDITTYEENEKALLIKQTARGLIQRLFELGLIEHHFDSGSLILSHLGDVILQKNGFDLIMED